MVRLIPLSLILLAIGSASPASAQLPDSVRKAAADLGLSLKYDDITGETRLEGDWWEVKSGAFSGPNIQMKVACVHAEAGAVLCVLGIEASQGRGWALGPGASITFLADDTTRIRLGAAADIEAEAGSVLNTEVVWVPISPDDLRQLGAASEVRGRIGKHEVGIGKGFRKELLSIAALVADGIIRLP